jgi:hypothetical protein
LSIRIQIQTKSGSESKPNPDPNPEADPNLIQIEKKGWIRIWIRIQMNPDPQPRYFALYRYFNLTIRNGRQYFIGL